MLWQKPDKNPTTKYHILVKEDDKICGACGLPLREKPDLQTENVVEIYDVMCKDCKKIWSIVCTSIESARNSLRLEKNLDLLRHALQYAIFRKANKGMIGIIEAKIRRLEKEDASL